jgi:hypothetical protein
MTLSQKTNNLNFSLTIYQLLNVPELQSSWQLGKEKIDLGRLAIWGNV